MPLEPFEVAPVDVVRAGVRAAAGAGGAEFTVGRLRSVAVGGWFGAADRGSAPLRRFNGLSQQAAAGLLRSCLNVDRWVQTIVDGRPYPAWNNLLKAARDAANPLTSAELEAALAHRQTPPLMPPRRRGDTPTEARLRDQLTTGAHSYEERFGRPFLVQTTGRSPEELLVQLWDRLGNDPDTEDQVLAHELRQDALRELANRLAD